MSKPTKIYSIRDNGAEEFGPPYVAVNDVVARRIMRSLLRNTEGADPKDYRLHCLGEYNTTTGFIKAHDPVEVSNEDLK